jgi:hypothetical protein
MAVAPGRRRVRRRGRRHQRAAGRLKPSSGRVKPDFKRMNPIQGAKNIFGPHALFEGGKSVAKVVDRRGDRAARAAPRDRELGRSSA